MRKIRWPIALIVVGVLALALPLVASASHSWSKYHWDKATNQPLVIGDNLTGVWLLTDENNQNSLDIASAD